MVNYLSRAENTFDNPQNVVPVKQAFKVSEIFDYVIPDMRIHLYRLKLE
jgi:alpha-L-arabinofuranosidase